MTTRRWTLESGVFLLWGLTSAAGLLVLLGMFTIGIFVLPIAAALLCGALILTLRTPPRAFTMSGVLLGPAAWSSYIGVSWAARSYAPDGTESHLVLQRLVPFVAVTVACGIGAVLLFVLLGARAHRQRTLAG